MAALPGRVRGRGAADASPRRGRPAAGRRRGGIDHDRGPWLLQRQGQGGARLAAALPVLAAGLPRRAGLTMSDLIAVTGATGGLGALVVDHLLRRTAADRIVAVARDAGKAAA